MGLLLSLRTQKAQNQEHDHVQCEPELGFARTFAQVRGFTPEVCKTALPGRNVWTDAWDRLGGRDQAGKLAQLVDEPLTRVDSGACRLQTGRSGELLEAERGVGDAIGVGRRPT